MVGMAEKPTSNEQEFRVACSVSGKWPPDFSRLSGLGFDSVSASSQEVFLKKVQSTGLSGKPHLFVEMRLRKDAVALRYSCPKGVDPQIRRMHSTLMLLRVLRLLPGIRVEMQSLSEFLLPPFELAAQVASQPYEALHKKWSDLTIDAAELFSKNKRLMASAEELAGSALEMEAENAALHERISKLESVSDTALCERVLEWLKLHRGAFNVAQFSSASGIQPARAEEGLEMLLKDGMIRKINGGYSAAGGQTLAQTYDLQGQGIARQLEKIAWRSEHKTRLSPGKSE